MKMTVVFPVLNQPQLADATIITAMKKLTLGSDVSLLVIDNESTPPIEDLYEEFPRTFLRLNKNIGVYPIFWEALKQPICQDADLVAFFHSDLIIMEKGWEKRVMDEFKARPKLGLLGFVGSSEIDASGGRGLGTTSNFMGYETVHQDKNGETRSWKGSPASAHGKVEAGFTPAAVVDGCAMIFRKSVLESIPERKNFPPHHFYDRLLSTEVREQGFEVGVLGIECDHISGQSVNGSLFYEKMAEEWATAHGLSKGTLNNWDTVLYNEAERQFLSEYRDSKHLIPYKANG